MIYIYIQQLIHIMINIWLPQNINGLPIRLKTTSSLYLYVFLNCFTSFSTKHLASNAWLCHYFRCEYLQRPGIILRVSSHDTDNTQISERMHWRFTNEQQFSPFYKVYKWPYLFITLEQIRISVSGIPPRWPALVVKKVCPHCSRLQTLLDISSRFLPLYYYKCFKELFNIISFSLFTNKSLSTK